MMLGHARGAGIGRAVVTGAVEMATERKRHENEGNGEENPHTLQGVMPQSPHCGLRIHQSGGQIEAVVRQNPVRDVSRVNRRSG